ncbi:MAG: TonB family protein [Gammaproteobacteria bacterium]|nr:TonB family protein [Gammaproteobacteria bacterium]
MRFLIDFPVPETERLPPLVMLGRVKVDSELQIKPHKPRDKPLLPLNKPKTDWQVQQLEVKKVSLLPAEIAGLDPAFTELTDFGGPVVLWGDRSAAVKLFVEPMYPVSAAREGVEGWVELEFTVSVTGVPLDVRIIDADPVGVFDLVAISAIMRSSFYPRVVDGLPVETVVRLTMNFTLKD